MAFRDDLIAVAEREWNLMGCNEFDINGSTVHRGGKETVEPYSKRIGDYWSVGARRTDLTGKDDDWPWSAAFVSFCMQRAGAGSTFPRAAGHAQYITKAVSAAKAGEDAPFVGRKPRAYAPKPGDIVTYSRDESPVRFDSLPNWFKSHGDIVTEVNDGTITVIGGNVGNAVTKRPFKVNAQGHVTDPRYSWIAVIETRLTTGEVPAAHGPLGKPHRIAANPSLRLRGLPDGNAEIITSMPNGTLVYVGAAQGDWAPIDMFGDGQIDGFAHTGYLQAV